MFIIFMRTKQRERKTAPRNLDGFPGRYVLALVVDAPVPFRPNRLPGRFGGETSDHVCGEARGKAFEYGPIGVEVARIGESAQGHGRASDDARQRSGDG